ncbi:hypothetical protein BC827DRAFT_1236543 [Russula dissimulans]|nr:hypothetical protein BC827DRAFT_1236543 [Russula dissimulans]
MHRVVHSLPGILPTTLVQFVFAYISCTSGYRAPCTGSIRMGPRKNINPVLRLYWLCLTPLRRRVELETFAETHFSSLNTHGVVRA